jgi:hypothetical protein
LVRPKAPGAAGRSWWLDLFLVAKRLGEVFLFEGQFKLAYVPGWSL